MELNLQKGYRRLKQQIKKQQLGYSYFPVPAIVQGSGKAKQIVGPIIDKNIEKVLLVTNWETEEQGLLDSLFQELELYQIGYEIVYQDQTPVTTTQLFEAVNKAKNTFCEGVLIVGDTSCIALGKGVALLVEAGKKGLQIGPLSLAFSSSKSKVLPVFCVSTGVNLGAEVTPFSDYYDEVKQRTMTLSNWKCSPRHIVLDSDFSQVKTPEETAISVLYSLTLAIESYLSVRTTSKSNGYAEQVVTDVFATLPLFLNDPCDTNLHLKLQNLAIKAGLSYRLSGFGYTRALSKCLQKRYKTDIEITSCVLLPWVLEFFLEDNYQELSTLAMVSGVVQASPDRIKTARDFLKALREFHTECFLPKRIKELKEEDILSLSEDFYNECKGDYPVKRVLNRKECLQLLEFISNKSNATFTL